MLNKVELDNNSLLQNYRDMLTYIPYIADLQRIIGPIIEFNGLRANEFSLIAQYLPNIPDYMVYFRVNEVGELLENHDLFDDYGEYDMIQAFISKSVSIQANFLNPNFSNPVIFVNFNSSRDENNHDWSYNKRLTEEKVAFTGDFLNQLYEIIGNSDMQSNKNFVKTLVYDNFDVIKDDVQGLYFKKIGRDLSIGENQGFEIGFEKIDSKGLFNLLVKLLNKSKKTIPCNCKLHGNIGRINKVVQRISKDACYISFGSTQTFSNTFLNINLWEKMQKQNYRKDSEELLKAATVANDKVEELLSIAETIRCESFSIKWNTLGNWLALLSNKKNLLHVESLFDNYISISKSSQGVSLYVVTGEFLSNKKIISKVEGVVGKKFKQLYI